MDSRTHAGHFTIILAMQAISSNYWK